MKTLATLTQSFGSGAQTSSMKYSSPFTDCSFMSIGRDWYVVAEDLPAETQSTVGLRFYDECQAVTQTRVLLESLTLPRC